MSTRIITVAGSTPSTELQAEQLATFAAYIKGVQFRFLVTRLVGSNTVALTHRITGMRVCEIPMHSAISAAGDWIIAGRVALKKLLESKGEDRIHQALTAAEKSHTQGAS